MICQKKKAKFYISDILIFDNYQLLYTCLKGSILNVGVTDSSSKKVEHIRKIL